MSAPSQPDDTASQSTVIPSRQHTADNTETTTPSDVSLPDSVTVSGQALEKLIRLIAFQPDLPESEEQPSGDVDLSDEGRRNEALHAAYLRTLTDADHSRMEAEAIHSGARGTGFKPYDRPWTEAELKSMTTQQASRLKLDRHRAMAGARSAVMKLLEEHQKELDMSVSRAEVAREEAEARIGELEGSYWYTASLIPSEIYKTSAWMGKNLFSCGKNVVSGVLGIGGMLYNLYDSFLSSEKDVCGETGISDGGMTNLSKEDTGVREGKVAATSAVATSVAEPANGA